MNGNYVAVESMGHIINLRNGTYIYNETGTGKVNGLVAITGTTHSIHQKDHEQAKKKSQPLFFGIIFLLLFAGFASHAHAKENKEFNLTPEVSMKLILLDKLRSGDCRKNERVNYKVDEDVCVKNGTVLIKRGAPASIRSKQTWAFYR